MNFIFYWKKSYFKAEYPLSELILYTNYPPNVISPSDTMWLVTKNEDAYILVGKFIIKQTMPKQHIHGDFCIVGNKSASVFYDLNNTKQKTFKSDMQKYFSFPKGEIGVYFRGKNHIRFLDVNQHQQLENFSKTLKTI